MGVVNGGVGVASVECLHDGENVLLVYFNVRL